MTQPSEKSGEIEKVLTLLTGKDRVQTIINGLCMTCDGEATKFKDKLSEGEYAISGMCQECQDEIYA